MDSSSAAPIMIVSSAEEMNPTRRSTMEDCHVVHQAGSWGCPDPDMALVGVYDGHGGRDIVDFLEDALAHNIAVELKHDDPTDNADIPTRLERAFLITDIQSRMTGLMTSGATVALCLVKKKLESNEINIYAANVGDARAVVSCTHSSSNGTAFRLTYDHRADDPKEIARIEAAGGFVLRSRVLGILAVARSLGDHGMKDFVIGRPYVSTTTVKIEASEEGCGSGRNECEEFVVVACDGLWDVIEDQEAVDLVRKSSCKKEEVAQVLVDEAMRRGSTDNITAVVSWL